MCANCKKITSDCVYVVCFTIWQLLMVQRPENQTLKLAWKSQKKIVFQGPLREGFKAEANECRYKYIVKKQSNPIFKRWRLYRPDPTHSHIIQLSFASRDLPSFPLIFGLRNLLTVSYILLLVLSRHLAASLSTWYGLTYIIMSSRHTIPTYEITKIMTLNL